MAPQAKRRRSDSDTQENPKDVASFDISQLKPHETVWFNDGNIVLATDVHLYRVHKGVLAKNSSVLKDMLDIPTGEDGEDANGANGEQWNRLPVVKMVDDSDESIYHLLMTLYDREYYCGHKETTFSIILSLLRLSTKYDFAAIRREVVDQLERYYPSNLEDWVNRPLFSPDDFPCDGDYQLLAAARQCKVQILLPILFYWCSFRYLLPTFFEDSRHLQGEDFKRLLIGRDKLLELPYKFGVQAFFPEKKCASLACSKAREELFMYRLDPSHLSFDLEDLDDGKDHDAFCSKFCETCKERSAVAVKEVRRDIWDSLPVAFGLGDWDKLKSSGTN